MHPVSDAEAVMPAAYFRPHSLAEAVSAVSAEGTTIVAGATDLYPACVGRPLPPRLLDVSAVREMCGITATAEGLRIGGATTWTEIAAATLPPAFLAIQRAARQIGSLQIQNRGTVAGNLCNASPAADGVPPLLILDPLVELSSETGVRLMPLAEFIQGYRRTAIAKSEILSALHVPLTSPDARSGFVKLGARKYLVISVVMAAALVRRDATGRLMDVRIAVGSASEKAQRLSQLEKDLLTLKPGRSPASLFRPEHFASLRPIDDARASASYRVSACQQVVSDALEQAIDA